PLGLIASVEPHLGHDIVRRVIAPPSPVLLRLWRQPNASHALDIRKTHRDLISPLLPQELAERLILSHDTLFVLVCIHVSVIQNSRQVARAAMPGLAAANNRKTVTKGPVCPTTTVPAKNCRRRPRSLGRGRTAFPHRTA